MSENKKTVIFMHYEGKKAFHSTYYSEYRDYLTPTEQGDFSNLGEIISKDFSNQEFVVLTSRMERSLKIASILKENLNLKENQIKKMSNFVATGHHFAQDMIVAEGIRKTDEDAEVAILITDLLSLKIISKREDNKLDVCVLPTQGVAYSFEGNWSDFPLRSFRENSDKLSFVKKYTLN